MTTDSTLSRNADAQVPEILIERVGVEVLEILQPLAWKIFEDTFGPHNDPKVFKAYMDRWMTKEQLALELADDKNYFALVSIPESDAVKLKPVGYFKMVNYAQDDPNLPEVVRSYDGKNLNGIKLQRFYVDAACQGKGIAHRMMEACFDEAKNLNKDSMWLGVWERNHRAIRFYEKWGFTIVGSQPFIMGSSDVFDSQMDHWMLKFL